jgi:hypothetical protein
MDQQEWVQVFSSEVNLCELVIRSQYFRGNIVSSLSSAKTSKKMEDTTLSQNIWLYISVNTSWYPRRVESRSTLLRKPQNLRGDGCTLVLIYYFSLVFCSGAVEVSVLWNMALCYWVVGAPWFRTTMVFQNMRRQLPCDSTAHPRRTKTLSVEYMHFKF